ncbi:peptide methionine sulfoxide reductase msrA/msrB [Paenibacillus catalpae]|uniref:Peptide methionine sulfoxide reductase MsrA n=1 Tax=Paenibacillus catalpae TaxID=1045775 RepID=A0A1I1VQ52_9BACL|nr:peptide methionine sulfoxide reductase msrA/msrB [Paenibacillus catalpae]
MNLKKRRFYLIPIAVLVVVVYFWNGSFNKATATVAEAQDIQNTIDEYSPSDTAIFAGGCFWDMEEIFEKVDGVSSVISGYTGGHAENPTYYEVGSGTTGHLESIEVHYNPNAISYEELLQVFWRNVDPTDAEGQFGDRGSQYQSAIFYKNNEQKLAAESSERELEASKRFDKPILTKITAATLFYKAESEHQDYFEKHQFGNKMSQLFSTRDEFLNNIWGKDREVKVSPKQTYMKDINKDEKLKTLTELQFNVTQNGQDETPFHNPYWDYNEEGIYVDIVSGEPLFSSQDKFNPNTGWPSFTKPLDSHNIVLTEHNGLFSEVVVKSRAADSFLGHVYKDGPAPTGLRFCINSSAMDFIPKADLEKRGYGQFASLFN